MYVNKRLILASSLDSVNENEAPITFHKNQSEPARRHGIHKISIGPQTLFDPCKSVSSVLLAVRFWFLCKEIIQQPPAPGSPTAQPRYVCCAGPPRSGGTAVSAARGVHSRA